MLFRLRRPVLWCGRTHSCVSSRRLSRNCPRLAIGLPHWRRLPGSECRRGINSAEGRVVGGCGVSLWRPHPVSSPGELAALLTGGRSGALVSLSGAADFSSAQRLRTSCATRPSNATHVRSPACAPGGWQRRWLAWSSHGASLNPAPGERLRAWYCLLFRSATRDTPSWVTRC